MPNTSPLPDAATRRRIGPWQPDGLPPLDAFEPDTNFLVRAAAGSGKTTALIGRMVSLVRRGVPLDDCAAITFTRKAASEMRARLYRELQNAQDVLRDDPDAPAAEARNVRDALNALPRCFIGTIHSFCARLLREHPLAAGLPPDFAAGLDDREHDEQRQRVWQSYLSDVWENDPTQVNHVASLGIQPAELVDFFGELCRYPDLTPYVDGPATPPDLDATVDTLRQKVEAWMPALPDDPADGDAKPGATADAVRDARRMLDMHPMDDPGSQATFVALFDGLTKADTRKSTDTTVRGDLTKSHWTDSDLAARLDNELLPTLEKEVIAPALRQWRAYAHRQLVNFVQPAVARYTEHRRRTGRLTFQDLLLRTRDLLESDADARRALQQQYPRLLVDEFQDTDPVQAEVLFYLASEDPSIDTWHECQPRDGSLFIVGDDKQSIYRFRRADLDVYSTVRSVIDRAPNGEDVTLETNFRSVPPLLEWCNDAFGDLFGTLDAPYQADYVSFTPAKTDTSARPSVQRLEVPYVKGSSSARQIARRNAEDIAALIASAYREGASDLPVAGSEPGDFMVLTRNTTRLDEFAEAFAERGLPYTMAGGGDVGDSTELYALVSLLTCVERPRDPVARLAYLRGPLVGLSDDALYRFRASGGTFDGAFELPAPVADGLAPEIANQLETAYGHLQVADTRLHEERPAAAIEQIVDRLGLMARARRDPGMGSLRTGRLLRVLDDVRRLDAEGHPWTAVRDALQQLLDGDRALDGLTLETGGDDAIRLLNVHKAKGLEAPVVILADPYGGGRHPRDPEEHVRREEGDVVLPVYEHHRYHKRLRFAPKRWATEFQDEEARYQQAEEDRLLYVATTRAEEQLIISRYRSPSWSTEKGYWARLYPRLGDVPEIEPPAQVPVRSDPAGDGAPEVFDETRRAQLETNTFTTTTVTDTPEEDRPVWNGSGYGRDFGEALHRLFEHLIQHRLADRPDADALSALLDTVLAQYDVENQDTPARRMVTAFLESDLWATLHTADSVHTELPVSGRADNDNPAPTLTKGTIDLLYATNDAWHLVDFKTNRTASEDIDALRQQYGNQLRAYARLWTAATDTPIDTLTLWVTDLGRAVPVSLPSD